MVKIGMPMLFKRLISKPRDTGKYLRTDGTPKTIIATTQYKFSGIGKKVRNESTLKKYWDYYNGEGTIFASINTTAWNTIMVGFYLVGDDKDAVKLIQSYVDKLDLETILLDNVVYALIYGDAFIEKVRDENGDIIKLKTVDPTTMIINWDKYGRITSYQQKIGGKLQDTLIQPDDIIHIRFFPRPSSPYGVSLIEPSKDTIDRKVKTDDAISNAIVRHGTAKYLVKVGTEEDIPPEEIFKTIKRELEDISSTNEIIVPGLVDVKTIDERGIAGVEEYFNYFQTQLIIGLLCPEESLGLGRGSTEATAKIKEIMYERMIRAFQLKIATQMKRELFNPILTHHGFEENSVVMRFNSVTDADEAVKAKWLGNLLRGYRDEPKPFTLNEVRAMFGFPPVEKIESLNQSEERKSDSEREDEIEELKDEIERIKERLDIE